jgi:hypothetical protein
MDIFDDQARKMYLARLPEHNPFGDGDDARNFNDFDIFTKVCACCQVKQVQCVNSLFFRFEYYSSSLLGPWFTPSAYGKRWRSNEMWTRLVG